MPIPNEEKGQFKKGHTGNPNGRPITSISSILKKLGEAKEIAFEVTVTDKNGNVKTEKGNIKSKKTINELVSVQLLKKAVSGDLKAIDMVLDRTEGKPKQSVDLTSLGEKMASMPSCVIENPHHEPNE